LKHHGCSTGAAWRVGDVFRIFADIFSNKASFYSEIFHEVNFLKGSVAKSHLLHIERWAKGGFLQMRETSLGNIIDILLVVKFARIFNSIQYPWPAFGCIPRVFVFWN